MLAKISYKEKETQAKFKKKTKKFLKKTNYSHCF